MNCVLVTHCQFVVYNCRGSQVVVAILYQRVTCSVAEHSGEKGNGRYLKLWLCLSDSSGKVDNWNGSEETICLL